MHLLVPYLFPDEGFLQAALQGLRLPALETLIARGKLHSSETQGIEGALCSAWGIAKQTDWPWAAISLLVDGGEPGEACWLRADPVHLHLQRDRLILLGNDLLDIGVDEAAALTADLRNHFGEAFQPQALQPGRWYWRLEDDPSIATTPLSLAAGRHIDPLLPHGPDALKWRALLNEIQMRLFSHPVNEEREARGLPAVNSIWFWGGGKISRAAATQTRFHCSDELILSVARRLGIPAAALQGSLDEAGDDDLILLSALSQAGQYGDMLAWREAIKRLDTEWLPQLIKNRVGLKIEDPIAGRVLEFSPADRWKFWRRAKPLAVLSPPEPVAPSFSPSSGDEFGDVLR